MAGLTAPREPGPLPRRRAPRLAPGTVAFDKAPFQTSKRPGGLGGSQACAARDDAPPRKPAPLTPTIESRAGNVEELDIASRRPDGTLRPFVTIWIVRADSDLYVRSVKGRSGTWFRRAMAAGEGRIRAGGVERDVNFEQAGSEAHAPVTAAYHEK